ncbi:MAG: PAS domain S-box protein [bacterium]
MAARMMLAMGALVVFSIAALGLLTYRSLENRLIDDNLRQVQSKAGSAATVISEYTAYCARDLDARVNSLVMQDIAVLLAEGRDPLGSPEIADVERSLLSQLNSKPEYLQFRLIDSRGMEIARCERVSGETLPVITPAAKLQDKSARPYFQQAMKLARGQIEVSRIDLNVEHGVIEEPRVPVMRFSAPLYGEASSPLAVVVINLDMRPVLNELRSSSPPDWQVYLASEDGDFLLHPDGEREYGSQLGAPGLMRSEFPTLDWQQAKREELNLHLSRADGEKLVVAAHVVGLNGGRSYCLFYTMPEARLLASLAPVRRTFLLTGLLCILVALGAALLLARSIARPLEKMTLAVRSFGNSTALDLPLDASGETGVLARAFSNMLAHLGMRTTELQAEIRERRMAEELAARQASQMSRFHALVESSNDAILTKDLEGTITSWNPAAERLYGYSPQEAIGHHISLIVPPERLAEVHEIIQRVRSGEILDSYETQRICSDGTILDVNLTASGIRNAGGEVTAVSIIARDITERKFTEGLFRLVVEASPSGIVLVDSSGNIELANAAAENMFAYQPGNMRGLSVEELIPGEMRYGHSGFRRAYQSKPERRDMGAGRDLYGLRRDGSEFPIEIGLNPVRTSRGLFILALVIDITERKRSQLDMAAKNAALERSNRDLEQFAYIASHDLREPLRMVSSYTELLEERYAAQLDDKAGKYIHYARDGAKRMQQMVADLLSFSRVTSTEIELEPVDLNLVLKQCMHDLRGKLDESGAVITTGDLPLVQGTENLLHQVMQNLLSNAIKFRGEAVPRVHVSAVQDGNNWVISVQDNGIGIDPQYHERIFQMFQRLHGRDSYEGSGIGLAITRKIIERLGGSIWLESLPGQGSRFLFKVQSGIHKPAKLEVEVEHD